jgi:hypothetical protein
MNQIPASIQSKIRRYAPVDIDGVTLYPVTVDEYDAFNQARPAIEFVQQSLPVAYVSMPLLQAFYSIDMESLSDAKLPSGLFARAILFLALALRLGRGDSTENRLRRFKVRVSPNDVKRLVAISFDIDGEERYDITPVKFQRWLPILAAQNGIALADATDNPALLKAEEVIQAKKGVDVDVSLEAAVSSVALFSSVDDESIYDWPILKLTHRRQALQRAMDYMICGIGEAQGAKWKHGNPVPSPFFPRKKEGSVAAIPMSEFAGGAAQDAIKQGMQQS